jgi:sec-independent protein translocase protein TatA
MGILGPIGPPEIIIILIVLLLVFGARRLPEMGRSLGKGMREFKDGLSGDEDKSPPPTAALPSSTDAGAADQTPADADPDAGPTEKPERETVS